MSKIKFLDSTSSLMQPGYHVASVVKVSERDSKSGTPQLHVLMRNAAGEIITAFFNLCGYRKDEDGEYILNKKGERTIDEDNTNSALQMLGRFAKQCGISEDFDGDDLVEATVGIQVIEELDNNGETRLAVSKNKFYTPEDAEALSQIEVDAKENF